MKLEKQRYYAFKLHATKPSRLTRDDVERAIWKEIMDTFGAYGAGKSGFYLKEINLESNIGIARVSLEFQEEFEIALARIHEISNTPVIIETILRSGTIKSLQKKLPEFFKPKT